MKDWAEILHTENRFAEAEEKIRQALELLENKDSDALFTLGVLLSEQGRDDESIEAYQASVQLNVEDAELCYNLGIKLGAKGKIKEEMEMYAKAVQVDPNLGGAWLNWGTAYAESGNIDDVSDRSVGVSCSLSSTDVYACKSGRSMFLKAVECGGDVAPKGMLNLGLLYHGKANKLAQGTTASGCTHSLHRPLVLTSCCSLAGNIKEAKSLALKASALVDAAKPILEELAGSGIGGTDIASYINQLQPLRLQCHRMVGQILASEGDLAGCEKEFRAATVAFPKDPGAWQMLARVLEIQGKADEAIEIVEKVKAIIVAGGWK